MSFPCGELNLFLSFTWPDPLVLANNSDFEIIKAEKDPAYFVILLIDRLRTGKTRI